MVSLMRLGIPSPCIFKQVKNKTIRCLSNLTTGNNSNYSNADLKFPAHAQIVICGGGVIGSSVAYHLAELGAEDIVLLEQGKYTCGTTWHSVGLIGQAGRDDVSSCRMMQYGRGLYKHFESIGKHVGWKECGSLLLARTKDRMIALQKKRDIAMAAGLECHTLSQKDIRNMCAWVRTDDLEGGLMIPSDGALTAPDVNVAFINLAKRGGVRAYEGVGVENITTTNRRVSGVHTTHGNITCDFFVNCTGMWSRDLGKKSDPSVNVPLRACEHFYITTTPISGLDPMLPVIRDYDGLVYFREWSGGIMAGGFEPEAKPTFHQGVPDKFQFQLLPDDWDQFQVLLDSIVHRIPAMESANVQKMFNGPESFSADGNWVIGESPEIKNYFVAAGMGGSGIVAAPAVGKHLAEWIITGQPSAELAVHDIQRFVPDHCNGDFLHERVKETLGMYTMRYPTEQRKRGRELVTSPLHQTLKDSGACFGQEPNGFEVPLWFYRETNYKESLDQYNIPVGKGTFKKSYWFDAVHDEYKACRENVGLLDVSSTTKIEVEGPHATEFLQMLMYSDIDKPRGTLIDTGMLTPSGRYISQCLVVPSRLGRYLVLCTAANQSRALAWMKRNLPNNSFITINDVTRTYAGIKLVGPKSVQLIKDISGIKIIETDDTKFCSKIIDIKDVKDVLAFGRISDDLEEVNLYTPRDKSIEVYSALMAAGAKYDVMNIGQFALNIIRAEQSSVTWEQNIANLKTPFEARYKKSLNIKTGNYIGSNVLEEQMKKGVRSRLVQFSLTDFDKDHDIWPWGGEPIYRNNVFCGTVATSAYGIGVDRMLCSGYVNSSDNNDDDSLIGDHTDDFVVGDSATYEIVIAGRRYHAEVRRF